MVRADFLRRYNLSEGGVFRKLLTCYRSPGLHAVIIYRFGHWLLDRPLAVKIFLKLPYVYLNHRMMAKWGIQIDVETKIDEGFLIFHYGGIFVGSAAVIGKNVSISHNVTIGLAGEGRRRGAPWIGNNVYIAPGANVSGKIRVGNNARIGANAVVNKDVPDNALVQVPHMQVVVFPALYSQKTSVPDQGA
jgi:serine O-acetyltransferase